MPSRTLASLLLAGSLACGSSASPSSSSASSSSPACPPGTHADPARARSLLDAVGRTAPGRDALAVIDDPQICFGGAARGTLRPDGVVVLADSLTPGLAAARLVHMLAHHVDGLHRYPTAQGPCPALVEAALVAEARGIVAEIEVWDALGRPPGPPYSFALATLAATPATRSDLVLTHLHAPPGAAPDGLDVLARDYRDRCARDRGPPSPK